MKKRVMRMASAVVASAVAFALCVGCVGNGNAVFLQHKQATVAQTLTGSSSDYTMDNNGFTGKVISTTDLNVRDTPDLSGKVLASLKPGAEIQVVGNVYKDGKRIEWYAIILNGSVAFASAKSIVAKTTPTVTPVPTPKPVGYTMGGSAFTGTVSSASGLNVREKPSSTSARLGVLSDGTTVQVLGRMYYNGDLTDWCAISYNGATAYVLANSIKGGTTATPKPGTTYTVAGDAFTGTVSNANGLNVRGIPSDKGALLGVLGYNAKVQVLGWAYKDGAATGWYAISYDGKTGYVIGNAVSGGTPAPTPTPTTSTKPSTTPVPTTMPQTTYTLAGEQFTGTVISTRGLNVRSAPNVTGKLLGALPKDAKVQVLGSAYKNGVATGWYGILYNGKTAYVSANNISGGTATPTPMPTTTTTPETTYTLAGDGFTGTVISTRGLNVRSAPSVAGKILGGLAKGAKVQVLGSAYKNGVATGWYGISYNGRIAYVAANNISGGTTTVAPPTTTIPTPETGYTVAGNSFTGYVISTRGLNVRSAPSVAGRIVGALPSGAKVQVLGNAYKNAQSTGWYAIRYNGTTAYVAGSNISTTPSGASSTTTPGTPTTATPQTQYTVAGNSFTGYVISTMGLNVRSAPNVTGKLIGALPSGAKVQVLGSAYKNGQATGWYGITYNGKTAYVSAKNISDKAPTKTVTDSPFTGYAIAKLGLNVRSAPSTGASTLGVLQYGDAVYVSGLARNNGKVVDWYVVSFNGKTGYVSTKYITDQNPLK